MHRFLRNATTTAAADCENRGPLAEWRRVALPSLGASAALIATSFVASFSSPILAILQGLAVTGLLVSLAISYRRSRVITARIRTRHEAVRAMSRREQALRTLTDNVDDVIWTTDATGRITYITPSVEKTLGFTQAEVLAGKVALLQDSTDRDPGRLMRRLVEYETLSGELIGNGRFESEVTRKDGRNIWTEVACSPLRGDNGELIGILGVTRDISARRRVEELKARLLNDRERAASSPVMAA